MAKDKIINCKAEKEVRDAFFKNCEDNFTKPSAEIYKFIRQYNKRCESKPIPLNQIKRKS